MMNARNGYILEGVEEQEDAYSALEQWGLNRKDWQYVFTKFDGQHVFIHKHEMDRRIVL